MILFYPINNWTFLLLLQKKKKKKKRKTNEQLFEPFLQDV